MKLIDITTPKFELLDVIILPTTVKENSVTLSLKDNKLFNFIHKLKNDKFMESQHIYIVSNNENIFIGDWYLDDTNNVRQSVTSDSHYWDIRPEYKKIIATTNKSLKIYDSETLASNCGFYLKSNSVPIFGLTESFIKSYIDIYNKKISNVKCFVEMGKLNNDNTVNAFIQNYYFDINYLKLISTRFAHECRLKAVVTNKDTCELFDTWINDNL